MTPRPDASAQVRPRACDTRSGAQATGDTPDSGSQAETDRLADAFALYKHASSIAETPWGIVYVAGYLVRTSPPGLPFECPPAVAFFRSALPPAHFENFEAVAGDVDPNVGASRVSADQQKRLRALAAASPIARCARRIWCFAALVARTVRASPVRSRHALVKLFESTAADNGQN